MAQKRSSKRSKKTPQAEGSYLRHAAWILAAACWLFLVVSLIGHDAADWPSSAVSSHNETVQNPTGIVGSTVAHWALTIAGAGCCRVRSTVAFPPGLVRSRTPGSESGSPGSFCETATVYLALSVHRG